MRTRRRRLYVATESTYGTDPNTDGSNYYQVPAITIGDLKDGKEQLATDYFTGRAHGRTAPVTGRDGWSFDVTVPLIGLATAAGDGGAPPANDWLDIFLTHIFGTQYQITGEGIATVTDSTHIVLDADQATLTLQSPIAIGQASVPSGAARLQMAVITDDTTGGTSNRIFAPAISGINDTAVVFGSITYRLDDDGGACLAFAYTVDTNIGYTLLGGRCTAASIKVAVGQLATLSMTFSGDTKTKDDLSTPGQKQSLDLPIAMATTPLKGLLSPLCFGTTYYAVSSIDIDLGIQSSEVGSTAAVNGRAGYESISMAPVIKCTPLYTDAIANLKRDITQGRLLVQIGSGLANHPTVQNSIGIFAEQAVAVAADPSDDNGMTRQSVEFRVADAVNFDANTASQFFQLSRF